MTDDKEGAAGALTRPSFCAIFGVKLPASNETPWWWRCAIRRWLPG